MIVTSIVTPVPGTSTNGEGSEFEYLVRRIEDIRPGMRVFAANPELDGEPIALEIAPAEWRLVHSILFGQDGNATARIGER